MDMDNRPQDIEPNIHTRFFDLQNLSMSTVSPRLQDQVRIAAREDPYALSYNPQDTCTNSGFSDDTVDLYLTESLDVDRHVLPVFEIVAVHAERCKDSHQATADQISPFNDLFGSDRSSNIDLLEIDYVFPDVYPSPTNVVEMQLAPSTLQAPNLLETKGFQNDDPDASAFGMLDKMETSSEQLKRIDKHLKHPYSERQPLECECNKKVKQYSKSVWEKIKPDFIEHYLNNDMDLKGVMRKLAQDHQFYPNEQMYKKCIRSWGAYKNVDKAQKHHVNTFIIARDKYGPNDQRTRKSQTELQQFCKRHELDLHTILEHQPNSAMSNLEIAETRNQSDQDAQSEGNQNIIHRPEKRVDPWPWTSRKQLFDSIPLETNRATSDKSNNDTREVSAFSIGTVVSLDHDNYNEDERDNNDSYDDLFDVNPSENEVQEISETDFNRCSVEHEQERPRKRLRRIIFNHRTSHLPSPRTEDDEHDDDTRNDAHGLSASIFQNL